MSYRQAVRDCKKLWRPVAEGVVQNKYVALKLHPEFKELRHECPFCHYALNKTAERAILFCRECPLFQQTGWDCMHDWVNFGDRPQEFASVIMALKEDV